MAGRSKWTRFQRSIVATRPGGREGDGLALHRASDARADVARALRFLSVTACRGGEIVFIGGLEEHRPLVRAAAAACDQHSLVKWTGGLLTNWRITQKRIRMLQALARLPEEVRDWYERDPRRLPQYRRMFNAVGGAQNLNRRPDVLVITDPQWQVAALNEASQVGIPVVALSDATVDPRLVSYAVSGVAPDLASVRRFLELCALVVRQGRVHGGLSSRRSARYEGAEEDDEAEDDAAADADAAP